MRAPTLLSAALVASLAGPALAGPGPTPLHEVDLAVSPTLVAGTTATLWVRLGVSTGPSDRAPLAGQRGGLTLTRESEDAPAAPLATFVTGADGTAEVRFAVPAGAKPGRFLLRATSSLAPDAAAMEQPVEVRAAPSLHLRTDRAVYRPGQRLRWRVTALHGVDAHPLPGVVGRLAIEDPRGTALWRGEVRPGDRGMAAGELPLGEDLVPGRYTLKLTAGDLTVEESVDVRTFDLPPFVVELALSSPTPVRPGTALAGEVVARYPYGEPVQGVATVAAGASRARVTLDAFGRGAFSLDVPAGARGELAVEARVVDGAHQERRATERVAVLGERLTVAVVPEAPAAAPGDPLHVTVLTTDGDGRLVPADVALRLPGGAWAEVGPSPGALRVPVALARAGRVEARARAADGRAGQAAAEVAPLDDAAPALRLDEAVVPAGAPVVVSGRWPSRAGAALVAMVVRRGAPVATAPATADAEGRFRAVLRPPPGVHGLATVGVAEVGWDPATGAVRAPSAVALAWLAPARLSVGIEGAGRFRPGEDATLVATVTDEAGRPVPDASVAASVVDERVLALGAPRPDLAAVLRGGGMDDARAAGLHFAALAGRLDAGDPAVPAALRALVEALPAPAFRPGVRVAAAERLVRERARLERARAAAFDVLLEDASVLGTAGPDGGAFRASLDDLLGAAGWDDDARLTPWRQPTTWAYARDLVPGWTFAAEAVRLADARLDRLARHLTRHRGATRDALHRGESPALHALVDGGRLPLWMAVDPWGHPVEVARTRERFGGKSAWVVSLVAPGPDGRRGTGDDRTWEDVYGEAPGGRGGFGMFGVGAGGGGVGFGVAGVTRRFGSASVRPAALEVAVRERFDETVLWVAGLATDDAGRVRLEAPLADSVTGWTVEVEAVGPGGGVGAGQARLETFLPLYADARVPRELTVGDRYAVPVVLANHTREERALTATFAAEGALEADGPAEAELTLPPGATGAVAFPVRATAVGEGFVAVRLLDGGGAVDASRRPVTVQGAGRLVRRVVPGALSDGRGRLAFDVPASFERGTLRGWMRLFRGPEDQATDGLEGMLREPHGCFEQTSSATYPNLLVLDLLGGRPGREEAVTRARELVARGYQRLISYEVPGGGFSWFGDAPANQALTAYGLLEFADMARVYPVDPELIARTRRWLVARQGRDGAWSPDAGWLHDWSAVEGKATLTAWVAWALAEAGERGEALDRALGYLARHADAVDDDPYALALWAAAEAAAGRAAEGARGRLAARATREAAGLRFGAGGRTLFYASGVGADVQVTALAAMALHRAGGRADADAVLDWLWSVRSPGFGWGTTQSTVLALRAARARSGKAPDEGVLAATLDGRPLGAVDLSRPELPALDLPADLAPGSHALALAGEVGGTLQAEVRLAWREDAPPAPEAAGLEVSLRVPEAATPVGARGAFEVTLRNPGEAAVPMPTLVIPVPPGFRAVPESLRALDGSGRVARAEDLGAQVNLYLERLDAGATVTLPYALEAVAACDVTQRPAEAYAYYDPETRGASAAARVEAAPRR